MASHLFSLCVGLETLFLTWAVTLRVAFGCPALLLKNADAWIDILYAQVVFAYVIGVSMVCCVVRNKLTYLADHAF